MKIKSLGSLLLLAGVLIIPALIVYAVISTPSPAPANAQLRVNPDLTVTVTFTGSAGAKYRVESCDDLGAGRWSTVGNNLTAGEGRTEWHDTRPMARSQRFYRVLPDQGSGVALASALTADASDSMLLIAAIGQRDYATVVELLRRNGISEETIQQMSQRFGQPVERVQLGEGFVKAAVKLSFGGDGGDFSNRLQRASSLGYRRHYFAAEYLGTNENWRVQCDAEIAACREAPIGWLNVRLNDPDLIRVFEWYDRYAERLHSVILNGEELTNHRHKDDLESVNQTLRALFELIKARKPDAFVWLGVVKAEDASDTEWLKAVALRADGLQIWNLRQFGSPFDTTKQRYAEIVGGDTPMMVAGFFGHKAQLWEAGNAWLAADKTASQQDREAGKAQAMSRLAEIGTVIGGDLERQEEKLRSLGYRGFGLHRLLVEAVTEARKDAQTK